MKNSELIFEKSVPGRTNCFLPKSFIEKKELPENIKRTIDNNLPELSELDVIRHYTNLSKKNFSVDSNFYPLGSCTMKYNSKIIEKIASLPNILQVHPHMSTIPGGSKYIQGYLEILFELESLLSKITGMKAYSTQPMAGAHGEFTGLALIAAYHKDKGNKKKYVIVPDSSHGTNPASAALCGYDVITIPSDVNGVMDLQKYKQALNEEVAAVMMTCPNTVGIFNPHIKEICDSAHAVDALVYYDGANLNAIMGKVRPGDIGFDVVHLNLHKTFGTPHGGGGPGSGPVGVQEHLIQFLPIPRIIKKEDNTFDSATKNKTAIGRVAPFYGNFNVMVKAYAYILLLGKEGLIDVSEKSVLNANYILKKLKEQYHLPYDKTCMHECVFSAKKQVEKGVHAVDIAKYLLDNGLHAPTVYFPLNVPEAIMIEPTETESKQTIDRFIEVMIEAAKLANSDPEKLHNAPITTSVGRLDETKAARELKVRWEK
ncbi:aminomethyl-transferring glycine dehydrogenase subunit GcvPB [Candidatus Margulisiibacteriota bacterium]